MERSKVGQTEPQGFESCRFEILAQEVGTNRSKVLPAVEDPAGKVII